MNKKEVIEEIKTRKPEHDSNSRDAWCYEKGFEDARSLALNSINKLDEPEKPVVPQCVADWFEDRKHNLELYISNLCVNFQLHKEELNDEFTKWYSNFENEPIQTLVKMKLYSYEVEKEKRYTAKLKLTDEYLYYDDEYEKLHHYDTSDDRANKIKGYHFTEDDLVKYNVWGNNAYEVNKVKGE